MMQLTSWGPMVGGAVLSLVFALMPAADVRILGDGDTEKFDLGELADGETRSLGSGDSEIVATRQGDVITIRLPGGGRVEARTMECRVGEGSCFAFVTGDDGASKVMVLAEEGDRASRSVFVFRSDGDDESVVLHEDHDVDLGRRTLRCPEGDTRMTLSKEDEGRSFYCPKHDLELEPVEIRTHGRKMIVRTDKDD